MSASTTNFFDPNVLSDGVEKVFNGTSSSLIDYLDTSIRSSYLYNNILSNFSQLMASAIFVWGLFYFLKAFWDMLRGQESWDEFFAFIVKKSIPLIVLFLFVLPVNLPPLINTKGNPFGIYLFKQGEEVAFNLPKKLGVGHNIECAPFFLAKDTLLYKKAEEYVNKQGAQVENSMPLSARIVSKIPVLDVLYLLAGKLVDVTISKIKGEDSNSVMKSLGLDFLIYMLNVFFRVGFVILFFTIYITFLTQLVLIKLKFIFFIPLFYLSTIFLLFDRYRDIFYENLKALFVWALQPTFLILATFAALEVGFFIMLLFVTKDSFIAKIFMNLPDYQGFGVTANIFAFFVTNIVILFFIFKMAITLPSRMVESISSGLNRIVSTAFRSIE